MILVVSSAQDEHGAAVLAELRRGGADAKLLDLADFPQHARISLHYANGVRRYELSLRDRAALRFDDVRVVWWRRPQPFEIDPLITLPSYRTFGYSESYEAFAGLWLALDVFWVNHPASTETAGRKVFQLRVAQEVGLEIPETLVTNDPDEAAAFVARRPLGGTVCKAFSATEQLWRETRLVTAAEQSVLGNVAYAPVIFQEYITPGADLRITLVGDRVFAAAIYAGETSYGVDFRMDMSHARVEPVELPDDIRQKLQTLAERLGLVYGAIDMRRTPDGRHLFLEINPAGQWLFIEQRTEQPITAAFATLLAGRDRQPDH